MLKNALIYRLTEWERPGESELGERLAAGRFAACGATQSESIGWLPPRGDRHDALVERIGGHWILTIGLERKAVPSSAVKAELDARLERIEAETGRRPKGRAAKELKEQIVHELLPRAFPKRAGVTVWIDPKAMRLVVGATSAKVVDGVLTRLSELLGDGVRIEPLATALAPATAMAGWLREQQAPSGFSIDRDCELKQPDGEKSAVRFARHTLEIDEIGEHIAQGKLPTQLALTWQGRVSFVLAESGALKKIKLLDVVLEGASPDGASDADGGFDADVALTTGELGGLIPDLIEALGGVEGEAPAAGAPSQATTARATVPA